MTGLLSKWVGTLTKRIRIQKFVSMGMGTPYWIEVIDGTGKKATGYLGAVGAGETAPDELLINPSFDVNTNSWDVDACTIASINGGQSGKCCELTRTGGDNQNLNQPNISLLVNALYRTSRYLKSGTSLDESSRLQLFNTTPGLIYDATSSGSWILYTGYYVPSATTTTAYFVLWKMGGTAGTMLFDEVSLKRVTDPPATAVHIVSSLNGTTRNWASIESGFDPNTITSWKIYDSESNIVEDQTGSTFNRGDFTTTNAFFWSSLDLSVYAGVINPQTIFFTLLGAIAKRIHIQKTLSGILGFSGGVTAIIQESFAGTIGFIGNLFVQSEHIKRFLGEMRIEGILTTKSIVTETMYYGVENP